MRGGRSERFGETSRPKKRTRLEILGLAAAREAARRDCGSRILYRVGT